MSSKRPLTRSRGKVKGRRARHREDLRGRRCGKKSGRCEKSMSAAPEVVCDADMSTSRYRQREGGVVESVLSESQAVLATCHSAGGRQLRSQSFDVVIIDEATQAVEAVCHLAQMYSICV